MLEFTIHQAETELVRNPSAALWLAGTLCCSFLTTVYAWSSEVLWTVNLTVTFTPTPVNKISDRTLKLILESVEEEQIISRNLAN